MLYPVASEHAELVGFERVPGSAVRRGRMRPAGRRHAVCGDRTLCGLPTSELHVFVDVRFGDGRRESCCAACMSVVDRERRNALAGSTRR
jgi:hypothetical protein